jgi:hypothetical protein
MESARWGEESDITLETIDVPFAGCSVETVGPVWALFQAEHAVRDLHRLDCANSTGALSWGSFTSTGAPS